MLVIAAYPPLAAIADEYKDLADTAYCAGVIVQNIEMGKRDFGATFDSRADQQLLDRKTAFVAEAIRQRKIAIDATNRLVAVGQADARLCWDTVKNCALEATKRADANVAVDVNERMQNNCLLPSEAVCTRIEACK